MSSTRNLTQCDQFAPISPQAQCSPQALPETPRHLTMEHAGVSDREDQASPARKHKENLAPLFAPAYLPTTPPRYPPGLEKRRAPPGLEMVTLPFTCSPDAVARTMAPSPSRTMSDTSNGQLTVWDVESLAAYSPLRKEDLSSLDADLTQWKYRTLSRYSPLLTTLLAHREAIAQTPRYSPLKKRLELRCRRVFDRRHGKYDAGYHKDGPVILTVPSPRSKTRRLEYHRKSSYRSPATSPLRISRTARTCSVDFQSIEEMQSTEATKVPTELSRKRTALGRVLSNLWRAKRSSKSRRSFSGTGVVSSWKRVVSQPVRGLGLANSLRRVTQ